MLSAAKSVKNINSNRPIIPQWFASKLLKLIFFYTGNLLQRVSRICFVKIGNTGNMERVSAILTGLMVMVSMSGFTQTRKLVPDYYSAQYAGSIGFFNIGAGYEFIPNKARLGIHYGYVPPSQGGRLHLATAKVVFPIVNLNHKNWRFNPIDLGMMASYYFGSEFSSTWSSRYPDGYYWWHPSIRFHALMEQSVTYQLTSGRVRAVTGYMEWNSSDLYLVSKWANTDLKLSEIVKAGIGIRVWMR